MGTLDTLAEEGSRGVEAGGVVSKLGLCPWAGSRVGLVENTFWPTETGHQVWDPGDGRRSVPGV